jgi:hypothetical protein
MSELVTHKKKKNAIFQVRKKPFKFWNEGVTVKILEKG